VEAGYGWISSDKDDFKDKDEAMSYYINMPITLAPGVSITPEFGVEDYMKDGGSVADDEAAADEGKDTYFGAKWMINF